MNDEFVTLAAEYRHEIDPIKGSRFLTTVAPTPSIESANEFIERVSAEFAGATHNCWAYRIGRDGAEFRSNDDGEPSGSAGRPILQQIEGHNVTDTTVVVTRWFGGTKLGVGGLMRAYGGATGRTLDRAPLRTVVVTRRIAIELPYECTGPVEGILVARGLKTVTAEYGALVRIVVDVPERDVETFSRELLDRTAGRASISKLTS